MPSLFGVRGFGFSGQLRLVERPIMIALMFYQVNRSADLFYTSEGARYLSYRRPSGNLRAWLSLIARRTLASSIQSGWGTFKGAAPGATRCGECWWMAASASR